MQEWLRKLLGMPSQAEKVACAAFERSHRGDRVAWTKLVADENNRFVVAVFYGMSSPPACVFYAVDKRTSEAAPLQDDTAYRAAASR